MDDLLPHLRDAPIPDALGSLDDAVVSALAARRREQAAGPRLFALAALLSLGTGVAAGSISGSPAVAAQPLSPFASNSALAPSTLLDPR
jgi:hypothetical protein